MIIHQDKQQHRFFTQVDGHIAYVSYVFQNNTLNITHTVVPKAIEGRGIAGHLTQAILQIAQEKGYNIIPSCSYTAAYIKRHPEYQSLIK